MIGKLGAWIACTLALAACATAPLDEDHSGSSVTYEPLRKNLPGGLPARIPSAPATYVYGESTVRYVPIDEADDEAMGVIDPASEQAPIDDESEHDDHELSLPSGPTGPSPTSCRA